MKRQTLTLGWLVVGCLLVLPQTANAINPAKCGENTNSRSLVPTPGVEAAFIRAPLLWSAATDQCSTLGVEAAFIPAAVEAAQAFAALIDEDLLNLLANAVPGSN